MKKSLTAVAIVAALSLTACGGGGDRPSKEDLSKEFTKKDDAFDTKFTKKQADCIAEAIVDSKLSDKAVKALKEQDSDFKPTKADEDARDAIAGDVEKCVTS